MKCILKYSIWSVLKGQSDMRIRIVFAFLLLTLTACQTLVGPGIATDKTTGAKLYQSARMATFKYGTTLGIIPNNRVFQSRVIFNGQYYTVELGDSGSGSVVSRYYEARYNNKVKPFNVIHFSSSGITGFVILDNEDFKVGLISGIEFTLVSAHRDTAHTVTVPAEAFQQVEALRKEDGVKPAP